MYRLISKTPVTRSMGNPLVPGGQEFRQSVVVHVNDNGALLELEFATDPTDQEILDRLPAGASLIPTAKADWERSIEETYDDWLRWKTTRQEAQVRSAPAAVVTALTTKENAEWANYLSAINAWRQAI